VNPVPGVVEEAAGAAALNKLEQHKHADEVPAEPGTHVQLGQVTRGQGVD
jgi:hypothetical protein